MPRGLAKKTLFWIASAEAILQDTQPSTVRGVCYQFFVQGLISSMAKKETDKVSKMLTTAREKGYIPWEWIVDETREVERSHSWDDPDEYMEGVKASYRKDWWSDQPHRLIVVSEKATVGGILRPVLREYGVGFLVLHGFSSATAMHDLARLSVSDERPLTLLYIGDHDPSGRGMSDMDIPGRMFEYGGMAHIRRLAIIPRQIATYDLPTFSAHEKSQDSRYAWFLQAHGESCCELDALDPNVLREIVRGAIVSYIDQERWQRAERVERAEMASLDSFLATWPTHQAAVFSG